MQQAVACAESSIELPEMRYDADIFGRVLWDYHEGRSAEYFLRRDDNYVERDSTARYFHNWEKMPPHERCLLLHASGRTLDFGAGAGQHSLALQHRGVEVVAVDSSPLAVELCRQRGVKDARVMDARNLELDGGFDTVVMMGNTLGIAGTPDGLRDLLTRLHEMVNVGGQILADITDYTATHDPLHLAYHRLNASRGRYPGSARLRVEYQGCCGEEFDWLLIKLQELREICGETGWRIARCVQVQAGASYVIGLVRM